MKSKCGILTVILFGTAILSNDVFAASSNGCDNADNNYITPELALCSTHVYNIGKTTNQDSASVKQAMRDVVALKSTIMMQQMYKQYQYLDATLSRLKTQLEREILTSKLEAAGATSSSSGSSGGAISGNNGVVGAENCMTAGLTEDVMNCLSRNLERIASAINGSDIGAAKRQIETDLMALQMYDKLEKTDKCSVTENNKQVTKQLSASLCKTTQECQNAAKTNNRQTMTECVNLMRVCITQNIEQLQNQNRGMYSPYMR